jgi:hypothetical protein
LATYSWLAVATHRAVLLNDLHLPRWGRREWRFFGLLVLVNIAVLLAATIFGAPAFALAMGASNGTTVTAVSLLIGVFMAYLLSRVCIVFPAIAIDRPIGIVEASTRLSKFRISAFVVTVILPLLVATPAWLAAFIPNALLSAIVSSAGGALATSVGIVALSFFYRAVTEDGA